MKTNHNIFVAASQNMGFLDDGSVDLIVTSPPYPMIQMWDDVFSRQNVLAAYMLLKNFSRAFEHIHYELDKVWKECHRVLRPGGFLCVNIGDATRTTVEGFQLFNNHSRVVECCLGLGFECLPGIIWRKQTNAPNKFMGSGMLPCGAYVTQEHEWILVFRKKGRREFKTREEKNIRRESAFFGEERNKWFSDMWEIKGVRQNISSLSRERSAAFPLEIPFRLINMYSVQGDTVLDPFLGLGTTTIAAMICGRNSVGVEIDSQLLPSIQKNISGLGLKKMNETIMQRYQRHLEFVDEREKAGKEVKYFNQNLGCKVMTAQETDIKLRCLKYISKRVNDDSLIFECRYFDGMDAFD